MKKCESCGLPLEVITTSGFNSSYCIYCQNQTTGELKTREEVREGSILAIMKFMKKTRQEAEKMVDENMPLLPRWSQQ